jgi:hypothetical protein
MGAALCAESVICNKGHKRGKPPPTLVKCSVALEEDGWGGWLGRYQAGLKKVALEELDRGQQRKIARHRDS